MSLFPIINKITVSSIGQNLIPVIPMSKPSSTIYFDYKIIDKNAEILFRKWKLYHNKLWIPKHEIDIILINFIEKYLLGLYIEYAVTEEFIKNNIVKFYKYIDNHGKMYIFNMKKDFTNFYSYHFLSESWKDIILPKKEIDLELFLELFIPYHYKNVCINN